MAPALLLLTVFFAGPIGWTFYAAFTDSALTGPGAADTMFVGFDNFTQLFSDPRFWDSVLLTVVFVFFSAIVGQNLLGLFLALVMRGRARAARGAVGAIVVAAWVIPEIVAGYVWFAFLSDDGTLNSLLRGLGLEGTSWLVMTPMLAVILANVWRGTAFSMLVYSAALSEVPTDLLEAASVDGAGPLRRLWHIVLPLIKRTMVSNLMLVTLQTLSLFTLIFVMTAGGPGTKSQTLPLYMYEQAFKLFQIGYGTAVALVLLSIGAVAGLVYVRVLKVEV
ncbi:sugar ABC transporter permease [Streptomyces triticagri]|uniref:Sugar ABC transporter permease n=2 Tax=Streptomyces triticagri TaxID=2293568 RepID=A0A372M3L5_9ACTN|nr:sugar ABC transporter permease [Streptomyces triticagri]